MCELSFMWVSFRGITVGVTIIQAEDQKLRCERKPGHRFKAAMYEREAVHARPSSHAV